MGRLGYCAAAWKLAAAAATTKMNLMPFFMPGFPPIVPSARYRPFGHQFTVACANP